MVAGMTEEVSDSVKNVRRITIVVVLFVVLKRKKAKHDNQRERKFLVREPM
jgi:hypothetical protein